MSAVTEIITTDQIHDLWGAGYTILPRLRDPFELPQELIPRGMSYQWNDARDKSGWSHVPYDRHPGYFGPLGIGGDINVSRLWLCERPTVEVDAAKAEQVAAAHKQVEDWAEKFGKQGVSGSVSFGKDRAEVGHGPTVFERRGTADGNTIKTMVSIPEDMFSHMSVIFDERDRLREEIVQPDRSLKPGEIADKFYAAIEADKSAPWWPTLHAILLPIAIENVRKSLKQQESAL